MNLSFFAPNRTVLLVSDEGLYVYNSLQSGVELVDFLTWDNGNFEPHVSDLIKRECGGKPVLILNDMTDQHFKGGQRLPKVGPLDRANVLRRKVEVAFPNYPIRGALQMKTDKSDKKGAMYLFTAIPMSDAISKTLAAVKLSMASIAGFCLLPVEATDMLQQFSKKLVSSSARPAKWAVFIGQHKNGSLRQVITRDGQLAMTRMTPISDISKGAEQWAIDVAAEYRATISYLSRFGYAPEETTDVIVIGDSTATEILEKEISVEGKFIGLTAPEAATILGIKLGKQEDTTLADALHVAWIGRKQRFILPMDARELSSIHKPRQIAAVASILLVFSLAFLAWQTMSDTQVMFETRETISDQQSILKRVQSEYQVQLDRMNALGFNIELIQGSIGAFEKFEDERVDVLGVTKGVAEALGKELRIDEFIMNTTRVMSGNDPYATGEEKEEINVEIILKLSFPTTIQPEVGIKQVIALQKRLNNTLPDFTVEVMRQVARPEYTETVKGVATQEGGLIEDSSDYTAELILKTTLGKQDEEQAL